MGKKTSLRLLSRLALTLAMALTATAARVDAQTLDGPTGGPTERERARLRNEVVELARKARAAAATPAERIETSDALGNALLAQPDEKAWTEAAALFKEELASSGGARGYKGLFAALFYLHRDLEAAELLQSLRKDGKTEDQIQQLLSALRDHVRSDDWPGIDDANQRVHRLDPNAPLRIGGKISRPEILHQVKPELTDEARGHPGFNGVVVLEAVIDKEGRTRNLRVLKGLPWGLDRSAVNTVQAWTFKPATFDGEPVPVWYVLTINYQVARQ